MRGNPYTLLTFLMTAMFNAFGSYRRIDGEEDALSRDMGSVAVSDDTSERVESDGFRRYRLGKRELEVYRRAMAPGDEMEVRPPTLLVRSHAECVYRNGGNAGSTSLGRTASFGTPYGALPTAHGAGL